MITKHSDNKTGSIEGLENMSAYIPCQLVTSWDIFKMYLSKWFSSCIVCISVGGGVEPPTKGRGGLTRPQLLEGVAGKERVTFFRGDCNFHMKNKTWYIGGCLKKGAWTVCRFKGGLGKKDGGGVFEGGMIPQCTVLPNRSRCSW